MQPDEHTSLLGGDRKPLLGLRGINRPGTTASRRERYQQQWRKAVSNARSCVYTISHPKTWNPKTIYREVVVHPISLLPAVFLGLLLNILDALSYGMILFPLGNAVFENLGSDGIAIFYVSTIVSQVIYSSGGSVFRGGIGSEMIEVV